MEILELLFASGEACGCFIQVLAAIVDVSAGVQTYRVGKKLSERNQARQAGAEDLPPRPTVWPLVLLVFTAVFLTGLALFALFRPRP